MEFLEIVSWSKDRRSYPDSMQLIPESCGTPGSLKEVYWRVKNSECITYEGDIFDPGLTDKDNAALSVPSFIVLSSFNTVDFDVFPSTILTVRE